MTAVQTCPACGGTRVRVLDTPGPGAGTVAPARTNVHVCADACCGTLLVFDTPSARAAAQALRFAHPDFMRWVLAHTHPPTVESLFGYLIVHALAPANIALQVRNVVNPWGEDTGRRGRMLDANSSAGPLVRGRGLDTEAFVDSLALAVRLGSSTITVAWFPLKGVLGLLTLDAFAELE